MKTRPVGAELFHADGQKDTDRHDETNSRFSQLWKKKKKADSKGLNVGNMKYEGKLGYSTVRNLPLMRVTLCCHDLITIVKFNL
jgi:hypothetical protein